jgi:hypothetical protein
MLLPYKYASTSQYYNPADGEREFNQREKLSAEHTDTHTHKTEHTQAKPRKRTAAPPI